MQRDTYRELQSVLDREVRPRLAGHGGDVEIEAFQGGVLYLRLLGRCGGCPCAQLTEEQLIREELSRRMPEILKVQVETPVSGELLDTARLLLRSTARKP